MVSKAAICYNTRYDSNDYDTFIICIPRATFYHMMNKQVIADALTFLMNDFLLSKLSYILNDIIHE